MINISLACKIKGEREKEREREREGGIIRKISAGQALFHYAAGHGGYDPLVIGFYET